ncbi:MAG: hypothetical protein QOC72_3953 [Methylobacteriaceae bacterium]|nr:hypothetical protein [Methylobacteriaceae bacterium]
MLRRRQDALCAKATESDSWLAHRLAVRATIAYSRFLIEDGIRSYLKRYDDEIRYSIVFDAQNPECARNKSSFVRGSLADIADFISVKFPTLSRSEVALYVLRAFALPNIPREFYERMRREIARAARHNKLADIRSDAQPECVG